MIQTGFRYSDEFDERLKQERDEMELQQHEQDLRGEQYYDHQDFLKSQIYLSEQEIELDENGFIKH